MFRERKARKPEERKDSSSESSCSEDAWGLLQRACQYFQSGSFQRELHDFRSEHAGEFKGAVEEEENLGEHTHSTRYFELHAQYLQLVESLLSEFLEQEGRTAEELFSDMKDAKEDNYTALFEEHKYHGFVDSVLDALEYQSFYRLMLVVAAPAASPDAREEDDAAGGGGSSDGGITPRQRQNSCRRQGEHKALGPRGSGNGLLSEERGRDNDDRLRLRGVHK